MGPEQPLPFPTAFVGKSADEFVGSVLEFVTSSTLLQNLCGGVHVLDFFTRTPDLYCSVTPPEWRDWFKQHQITDILDLLMREDLSKFDDSTCRTWRGGDRPPETLINFIKNVHDHSLNRAYSFSPSSNRSQKKALARDVAVGMKPKKIEEVSHFASYVDQLTAQLAAEKQETITHLVDFGSGQNYLGRALASDPYNKQVVALERKLHNITGAKKFDEMARLTEKPVVMRNKKQFRAQLAGQIYEPTKPAKVEPLLADSQVSQVPRQTELAEETCNTSQGRGSVQYVEYLIQNGDLQPVIQTVLESSLLPKRSYKLEIDGMPLPNPNLINPEIQKDRSEPSLMIISLHSCGNLVHHGIRSLLLNSCVAAVALVGCCYNLVTERLGPPTFKLPTLRTKHPRLVQTSAAFDPHGFPMSEYMCQYEHKYGRGIRLNITARMMAVQAPRNWGAADSEAFFTRHFYRALLQRIFLDYGIVEPPKTDIERTDEAQLEDREGSTNPIIIGSLRKSCYASFVSYVRGALQKLSNESQLGKLLQEKLGGITDEEIKDYERNYCSKKHELSVIWSLMAFSASVIETVIVLDRWLFLREQDNVRDCWVEPVFEYSISPRNLVIVGIKK
ncbi:MAG: hypothetical protein M1820_009907 [Bogoriella megaspora]|nr:MAG: hypothetical protein M1820_009907 [Bogoriella megaspora]